ncbi:MAG: diguanylate cyclase [Candidatus Aminicenantes bacterium]|nr:diguanylate cyclase [Candidatus Aminicenantes bacterium]
MIDRQIKVLLIEDNPKDARLIQKMVEEKNWASFDLTCVEKLQAGLKLLSNGGADIVLLDLDLPDSKGLNTFIKVHAQESSVPIVVLTGLDDEEIGLEAVQKGAQDFLIKGKVDRDLLIRSIRYAIERRQAEEELRRSKEKNRSLLIAIPDIMFRLNKEGVFLEFITAKNFPLWMNASEFVGKNVQDVLDSKISKRFMRCLKQAAKTENTQILQYQLSVGGKIHHYEARIVATWGEEALAIVRDFTDQKQAEKLAETDPLTNIYNRRKFSRLLDQEIQRVERYDRFLSIVMLDIDHFKKVNDTYGHDTGDYVLRRITELIKENIRITDILARYGGEEFVIILPETDVKGASRQIDRMRKTIEKTSFDGVGNLTISAGITGYMGGDSCKSMITRADKALYSAKEEGRNKIRVR